MAIVRCEANEHFYDDNKYSSCPFCRSNANKTIRSNNNSNSGIKRDKTVLMSIANHEKSNQSENKDIKGSKMEDLPKKEVEKEKTIAPWQKNLNSNSEDNENNFSIAPIVAWLVIIEGNKKGQDYRIIPALNTIGRDDTNTIVIDNNDKEISRQRHCIIEFDKKNKKFYLERGSTTTYLNDNRVGGEGAELKENDIIEIGSTKLKFIPFCNEEFCWDL